MFIRNDAPDTKNNLAWRRGELILGLSFLVAVMLIILNDSVKLSQELKSQVAGIKPTFWSDSSKADLNDGQWSTFRNNLSTLLFGAALHVVVCNFASRFGPQYKLKASLICGLLFAVYLHGAGCLFLVALVLINYAVAKGLRGTLVFAVVVWVGNLGFLVMTEYYHGYKFVDLGLPIALDKFPKSMSWHRVSNLCMLKLISYMMDYNWSLQPSVPKQVTSP
jgi:hypothetical protein